MNEACRGWYAASLLSFPVLVNSMFLRVQPHRFPLLIVILDWDMMRR